MTIKTCRHCDISFQRGNAVPIPHDRCDRCHEEIDAMKTPLCADGRPCGQQDHPDEDAYCLKCPHEPKCSPDEALRNKYERESCDMTDEHPLDRLAQAGLVRATAKWERGDMDARSKYHREIKPGVWVDVYSVLVAYGVTNPADAHAIKKMLMPGGRGAKDSIQDREEAIASLKRAIEIEREGF